MSAVEATACPTCEAPVPAGAVRCPACAAPRVAGAAGPRPAVAAFTSLRPAGTEGNLFSQDLARRLARLGQWKEAAAPLGIPFPRLPTWAEEIARRGTDPERWAEVIRGVERLALKRVVAALEEWERRTEGRLARLEAYAVDSRLEREQIEDVLRSARAGDLSLALGMYQQVDRVVALKERHLDQAREDLERVVSLVRDMEALGLPTAERATAVAEELERELRAGRLAALKQRIRTVRLQSADRIKSVLPPYIREYGTHLVRERADGVRVDREVTELARAARDVAKGRPEDALKRLRALVQAHGGGRSPMAPARDPERTG